MRFWIQQAFLEDEDGNMKVMQKSPIKAERDSGGEWEEGVTRVERKAVQLA